MAQAEIRYRDQVLTFPPVDDIEAMIHEKDTDRRLAFSTSGLSESILVLPREIVEIAANDVVNDSTVADIEAFWSHARRGRPYSFAEDNADQVLTGLELDAPAGSTRLALSSLQGIAPGRKYLLMDDLLGRNDGVNILSPEAALCDSVSAFTLFGSGVSNSQTWTSFRAGSAVVRFFASTPASGAYVAGPAISPDSFVTFSIWYSGTTPNVWRLRIGALVNGVWVWTSSALLPPPPAGWNLWRRGFVTAYLPDGADETQFRIQSDVGGSLWAVTDGWQAEIHKRHPTPWVAGGAREATASSEGLEEVVTVKAIRGFSSTEGQGLNTWVTLESATKFPHKKRDAFRSRRYWENCVALDSIGPLALKNFTSDFKHRFREIP